MTEPTCGQAVDLCASFLEVEASPRSGHRRRALAQAMLHATSTTRYWPRQLTRSVQRSTTNRHAPRFLRRIAGIWSRKILLTSR